MVLYYFANVYYLYIATTISNISIIVLSVSLIIYIYSTYK